MTFKIISTTDNQYIGEYVTFNGGLKQGDTINYKNVSYKIDKVVWINENTVKLVSSSYIATLELLG